METESIGLETFSKNTFSLKTENQCFLCLTKLGKSSDKIDCLDSDSIFIKTEQLDADAIAHSNQHYKHSLWAICRYLKLNPKQFLRQTLPNSDLKENDQLINQCRNFVVPLCENCGNILDQITKLCTELEVLQMKVDDKLQSLRTILQKNQEEEIENEQNYHSVVKSLRSKIKTSCETRVKQVLPKVKLSALKSLEEAESLTDYYSEEPVVIKMESLETIIPQSCKDASISRPASQSSILKPKIKQVDLPNHEQCDKCHKWYRKNNLSRHKTKHCKATPTPDSSKLWKPVKCNICQKKFPNSSNLLRHSKIAHLSSNRINGMGIKNQEKVKCEQCDRVVLKTNIWRHLEENCRGGMKVKTQCRDCKKWFHNSGIYSHREKCRKATLQRQQRICNKPWKPVHAGVMLNEGKPQCDMCPMSFPSSSNLLRHIRIVHPDSGIITEGKTEVKCKQCDRVMSKDSILRHLKMHCPGRPEKDPLGEAELEKEWIKSQEKLSESFIDTSFVKPDLVTLPKIRFVPKVRCNQCGAMIGKIQLLRHKKFNCPFGPRLLNPELKPTKCYVCGKIYKNVSNMYRHRKKEHPEYRSGMQYKIQDWQENARVKSEIALEHNYSKVIGNNV